MFPTGLDTVCDCSGREGNTYIYDTSPDRSLVALVEIDLQSSKMFLLILWSAATNKYCMGNNASQSQCIWECMYHL